MNRTEDYFDGQFAEYDEERGNAWGMNWRAYMVLRAEDILHWFENMAGKRKKPSVLEIGCASGDFTERCLPIIEKRNGKIHGVDISQKAVNICRKRFAGKPDCTFSVGRLPMIETEKKYDFVLCMDVMEYFDIDERDACYFNMESILEDGGVFLLQMPLANEDIKQLREQVNQFFTIEKTGFVYGQLWYDLLETRLQWITGTMYFRKHGIPFDWFGKVAYRLMRNQWLVSFFFRLNKRFFPRKRSHIVMACVKKTQDKEDSREHGI